MSFPYIKSLVIDDCYTYQDVTIDTGVSENGFKHIIITGKNASGKTTILNRVAFVLNKIKNGADPLHAVEYLTGLIINNKDHASISTWESEIKQWKDININFSTREDINQIIHELRKLDYILSFFKAHRKVDLIEVKTVTTEAEFTDLFLKPQNYGQDTEAFIKLFKQYLVNKKVYQAFDLMDSNSEGADQNSIFFENIVNTLREIFHDKQLELKFVRENFEFFLKLSDGREVTLDQLSEGFSAFLSIIMDLLMRTDLIRKQKNDYSYNPCGYVIIDEPETHLHLSMQYEILPLINNLFPNVQLVIATHSPAVISSLKNAIVYDLSSQKQVSDWLLGSSYSELMITHFGLENEFSPVADKIISDINTAVREKDPMKLKDILIENDKYLTASLRLEIESQIIHIEHTKEPIS